MKINLIKEKILKHSGKYYKGSLRFYKPKLLMHVIGDENFNYIKNLIDKELHNPTSLLLHCFLNDIYKTPKCHCGNLNKFNTTKKKFSKYCSNKCKWKDNENIQKRKRETCLNKYGAINVLASDHGKIKAKTTLLKKYGVENYTKTEEYRKLATGRKHKKETKKKMSHRALKDFYDSLPKKFNGVEPRFTFDEYKGVKGYKEYTWYCRECEKEFLSSFDNGKPPICNHCKPSGTDIELVIKDFLDENNIKFIQHTRKVIENMELDFYIPCKKMAIEIHGLYWHSTKNSKYYKNYHIDKLKECNRLGISLIQIYADEIYHKEKIVKNRLKCKLGINKYKIFARKCQIKEISNKEVKPFLEKYHIQGHVNGNINLGLFHKNRMVSVMSFSKNRKITGHKNTKDHYELLRYATIPNFSIVGGSGKLFNYFINNYNYEKIYSYSDLRWNDGSMYEKIGMKYVKNTTPNYWYTKDFKSRMHRFNFRKSELRDFPHYEEKLSEWEIMEFNKFYRTWDCGSKLFEYEK